MAQKLESWIKIHVKKFNKKSFKEIQSLHFHRDPNRAVILNDKSFYSPSDGILIYQDWCSLEEEIVEIKGKKFNLLNIIQNNDRIREYKEYQKFGKFLVSVVFMTFYDCHILRIPTDGLLKYKKIDSIYTRNAPTMVKTEKKLFEGTVYDEFFRKDWDYLFVNERSLNTIDVKGYKYDVVSIADDYVDVIVNFDDSGETYSQGERFSIIRYGSSTVTVLPPSWKVKFKPFYIEKIKNNCFYHVEAGRDSIVNKI